MGREQISHDNIRNVEYHYFILYNIVTNKTVHKLINHTLHENGIALIIIFIYLI